MPDASIIPFLLNPAIIVGLTLTLLVLKIYYFYRYRDWFVLGIGIPLLFVLWIYVQELMVSGALDKPTARFSSALLLFLLILNCIYDFARQSISRRGR